MEYNDLDLEISAYMLTWHSRSGVDEEFTKGSAIVLDDEKAPGKIKAYVDKMIRVDVSRMAVVVVKHEPNR